MQLRLNTASPTLYKGLAIFDKAKGRTEGVTPHAATYHAPSRLFFVSTSRRSIFMPHMPPPEEGPEDPHAAYAYRLAEAVARAQKGEVRFQLRGLAPDGLAAECEHKFKPLEHVLCLETVKLNVPATAEAPPRVEVFVAAGVGTLVTEDWSSQGSVSLFRVVREEVLGFSGAKLSRWALVEAHRREFTGPVTAIATCSGNLVVAFGHNVEMYKWTGGGLKLVSSPLSGVTRLVSCLSIIKNQYMLVGNARKGLAFVQVKEAKGTLSLLSRDFGRADAAAVEFLLDGQTLAFLQADSKGNLAVFRYFPKAAGASFEPPGLRAVPVGRYHLAHKVTAVQRVRLQSASRVSYGALASASSGALVWVQPVSAEHHKALDALAKTMVTNVEHVAGLNPTAFRSLRVEGHVDAGDRVYGAPPQRDVLDGELLWGFVGQSRAAQEQLARSAGAGTVEDIVSMLRDAHSAAAFY